MNYRPYQFGISTLLWVIVFAAVHCWLCSLGAYGIIITLVADKHILVAYLCRAARVDRKCSAVVVVESRQAA